MLPSFDIVLREQNKLKQNFSSVEMMANSLKWNRQRFRFEAMSHIQIRQKLFTQIQCRNGFMWRRKRFSTIWIVRWRTVELQRIKAKRKAPIWFGFLRFMKTKSTYEIRNKSLRGTALNAQQCDRINSIRQVWYYFNAYNFQICSIEWCEKKLIKFLIFFIFYLFII